MSRSDLPIDAALPALREALAGATRAVLVAPPGAGKSTRVPLVLMEESWSGTGKILVLEPRRIAARAVADRMAKTLGEEVGGRVGLRVRFGSKVSARTRVEVVTEGIFTRMILDDPTLEGVAAVLFDEFHERSLDADLGLALALDTQSALRDDLRILVMSATLDGARVAALLGGAPVVESAGRAFPVVTRHVGRDPAARLEDEVARTVRRALAEEGGSALVFLPGAAEIRRTAELLAATVKDPAVDIVPLFGALDRAEQDRAIEPAAPGRRKVVLATSIAETSLTIEGVRIVVDSGLARVPRFEPDLGLTRLETVRVSRAAADQRRGRAGRTEPGVCYRLWEEAQEGAFPAYQTPEILAADLSSLLLDCAAWGVTDPASLAFLDPPPKPAVAEARALLTSLGGLDADGRITEEGKRLRALPLTPRLGRMVVDAAARGEGRLAADLALLVSERGLGGEDVHLGHRLDRFRSDRSRRAEDARRMAAGWLREVTAAPDIGSGPERAGAVLALAFPDRIARARGKDGDFVLANGRGGSVDPASPLTRETFLAVAEIGGVAARARILSAAPISLAEIEADFADRIETREEVTFDRAAAALRAKRARRLGAVSLGEQTLAVPPTEESARALAEGIAALGIHRLPWSKSQLVLRHRVSFLRRVDESFPDLSDTALAASAAEWLAPQILGKTALSQIGPEELSAALDQLIPWDVKRRIEAELPSHFDAPSGQRHPIDYEGEEPVLSIRVQELFGLAVHPTVARGKIPLVVELLSPAHRPVQITRDLPGFWKGSWQAVKSEMKGRYPRHPWPDDPASAAATHRAKPRGT
ncbi:ATP-dependent helicase HrpB [Phreatobacter oligotrophus]|uniref:ATP-dependent helicase HrpB n=1 Tax=Phreatobacter oligotrophus TaxID=1122261 RepID=A0A2T4ZE42_9HYPH|nr:ATP-dependent helicase HrpB [Phreatobacter oligotrophus]PTM60154.1 ATP-dependent helicase HrpB [Phreatobacter oligotrophus]